MGHRRRVGEGRAAREVEDPAALGEDEDTRAEQLGAHHLLGAGVSYP